MNSCIPKTVLGKIKIDKIPVQFAGLLMELCEVIKPLFCMLYFFLCPPFFFCNIQVLLNSSGNGKAASYDFLV